MNLRHLSLEVNHSTVPWWFGWGGNSEKAIPIVKYVVKISHKKLIFASELAP